MKQSQISLYIKMTWYFNAMLKTEYIYNGTVMDKCAMAGLKGFLSVIFTLTR